MQALQAVLSDDVTQALIDAAVLAPSGDNTQPWRFDVDADNGFIVARVDPSRDPSPMNAGQRMSRIAVGAAAENILRTAAYNGLEARIVSVGEGTVTLLIDGTLDRPIEIETAVRARCTNRKPYDGRALTAETVGALDVATVGVDGVETHWMIDREQIKRVASIVRRADAILFSNPSMRRAFLSNVRFDAADDERVSEGLSLASLELKGAEKAAFRMLPKLPDWAANLMRLGASIGRQSEKLVNSSSGVCMGIAFDDEPQTDFAVGRAMQRAWLALTEQGLAVQPMMSLPVLTNASRCGWDGMEAPARDEVERLAADFGETCPAAGNGRVAFLLRFGHCEAPTGRTGRRSVTESFK